MPWDLDRLTFQEVDVFVRWLEAKADAQRRENNRRG